MSVSAADVEAARRWLTDQLGTVEIADDAVLDRAADVLLRWRSSTRTGEGEVVPMGHAASGSRRQEL